MAATTKISFLVIIALKLVSGNLLSQLVRETRSHDKPLLDNAVVLLLEPSSTKSQQLSQLSQTSNEDNTQDPQLTLLNTLTQLLQPSFQSRNNALDRETSRYSDHVHGPDHIHHKYGRQRPTEDKRFKPLKYVNKRKDKNYPSRSSQRNKNKILKKGDKYNDRNRFNSRPDNNDRKDKYYNRHNTLQDKLREDKQYNKKYFRFDKQRDRDDDGFRNRYHKLKKSGLPVVKNLLRMANSLNCDAQIKCKVVCERKPAKDKCNDECENDYECEEEAEEEEYEDPCQSGDDCNSDEDTNPSTRGERLVTEKTYCPRCKK